MILLQPPQKCCCSLQKWSKETPKNDHVSITKVKYKSERDTVYKLFPQYVSFVTRFFRMSASKNGLDAKRRLKKMKSLHIVRGKLNSIREEKKSLRLIRREWITLHLMFTFIIFCRIQVSLAIHRGCVPDEFVIQEYQNHHFRLELGYILVFPSLSAACPYFLTVVKTVNSKSTNKKGRQ